MRLVNLLITFAVLAITCTAKVNALQCYVCDKNCDTESNRVLEYCGPIQNTPTTLPTTTPTTLPTTTDISTRTTAAGADTSSRATTSTATSTQSSSSTTPPSTSSAASTTQSSTSEIPSLSPNTTTTVDGSSSTTPSSTSSTSSSVQTSPATTTVTIPSPMSDSTPSNQLALRKRRSLTVEEQGVDKMLRNYHSISRHARDVNDAYACYSIDKNVSADSRNTIYGCINIPAEKSACDIVRTENGIASDENDNCGICYTDGCNGSATIKLSITAALALLLIKSLL